MWLKLLLLVAYVILLLAFSRILEVAEWYTYGRITYSSTILNPMTLSVHELKSLIEGRGLDSTIVIEKQDLVQLLVSTGELNASSFPCLLVVMFNTSVQLTNHTRCKQNFSTNYEINLLAPKQNHTIWRSHYIGASGF